MKLLNNKSNHGDDEKTSFTSGELFVPHFSLDMGLREFFLTINSEPIGTFVALARSIKDGAGITEQLLFDKVSLT